MTHLQRLKYRQSIQILLVAATLVCPAMARAQSSTEANEALDKANADYYRALNKLNQPSAEDKERLRKQIIGPAEEAAAKARVEEARAARSADADKMKASRRSQRATKKIRTPEQRKADDEKKRQRKAARGKTSPKKSVTAGKGKSPSTQPATTDYAPREEVVVDGNGVPAELEFPGPQKKAAPAPSKTVSPVKTKK